MKTGTLATLMFIGAISLLVEVNANNDDQMCPHEYFKKHPESFHKAKQMMKERGSSIDFSKLQSCSENKDCPQNRLCCHSPCGLKCTRPVTENNAEETLALILKDVERKESLEPYVETEVDKKLGMCPDNYLKTHPGLKEKLHNEWGKKHQEHKNHHHDGQCQGQDCAGKHKKHHKGFQNLSSKIDCNVDGDCRDHTRCCNTMCGKKCMKPVFTEDDYKKSMFGDKGKHRPKRDLETQDYEEQDHGSRGSKGHGRGYEEGAEEDVQGKGHGKGAKNGKGHGKGLEHGKGAKNGKGHGKGQEHGKGAKNGKGHGKGLEHGKGAKNGKGHGKGLEHGKGAKNGKGHGKGRENEGQVEGEAGHFREKRFAEMQLGGGNIGGLMGGLVESGQEANPTDGKGKKGKGKGKGKGKNKEKGKKNKSKKGKGKNKGSGGGNEEQN